MQPPSTKTGFACDACGGTHVQTFSCSRCGGWYCAKHRRTPLVTAHPCESDVVPARRYGSRG